MNLRDFRDRISGKHPTVKTEDYEGHDRRNEDPRLFGIILSACGVLLVTLGTVSAAYVRSIAMNTQLTHDAVIQIRDNAQNTMDRVHQLELDRTQIEGDLQHHHERILLLEAAKRPDNGR